MSVESYVAEVRVTGFVEE